MEGKIRIMVLCASGMSSGLVVDSIIEHAPEYGVEVDVHCSPSLRYRELDYNGLDIILIAPQVKSSTGDIMEYVKGLGLDIPYMNIQMREYGLVKGGAILKQALEVVQSPYSFNEQFQILIVSQLADSGPGQAFGGVAAHAAQPQQQHVGPSKPGLGLRAPQHLVAEKGMFHNGPPCCKQVENVRL